MTKQRESGSNLVVLSGAKDAKETPKETPEEAPLEAFAPQALKIEGTQDDWCITGCDGDQFYVWIATRKSARSKQYLLVEVYPGIVKRIARGKAKKIEDLINDKTVLQPEKGRCNTESISDLLLEIEATLFEDFEFDDDCEIGA